MLAAINQSLPILCRVWLYLDLGQSVRLTEINLPDGAEIPGLTEETDQMVISVNAPKAVEEEPEVIEGDEVSEETDSAEASEENNADNEGSEES